MGGQKDGVIAVRGRVMSWCRHLASLSLIKTNILPFTREEICHYWPRVTTGCPIKVLTCHARPFTSRPKCYQYLRLETNSAGSLIECSVLFLIAHSTWFQNHMRTCHQNDLYLYSLLLYVYYELIIHIIYLTSYFSFNYSKGN
jgi:hypothetical protein